MNLKSICSWEEGSVLVLMCVHRRQRSVADLCVINSSFSGTEAALQKMADAHRVKESFICSPDNEHNY